MRTVPPELLADVQADCTTLAFIWTITMADGRQIRGTEHDQDITIPPSGSSPADPNAGTYYAVANVTMGDIANNTDMSVDNLDVTGALANKIGDSDGRATVLDVSVDDIETGLLDQAPVAIMVCNWAAPSHGYLLVKTGYLGQIKRDSDGKYTTEVRGLTQLLTQTCVRTFSTACNVVKFGDTRCKYDVAAKTIIGEVAVGTGNNQLQFAIDLVGDSPSLMYRGGILTFTSGANEGFSRELKIDPLLNSGVAVFWDQFPELVNVGDTFTLTPGCDRQLTTCQNIYNNLVNFRGFGAFIPGVDSITAGPTTTQGLI
jgi:uncharacterized phage protein (TIGR02218 family)